MIKKKLRVGIFGGTFNPPHVAHVRVARAFVEKAALDSLLIIPTNEPPHKSYSGSVSAQDRLKMCKLAFSDVSGSHVSDMEISRGGKSYTIETISSLANENTELFLLCGTDMFLSLDTWFQAEKIFKLATICYVRREADFKNELLIRSACERYISDFGASVIEIESETTVISSTEIRNRILNGDFCEIPESVAEYIKERGLYK